jgi:RNA polymerase sigma-70 factor (ECF subfamily)
MTAAWSPRRESTADEVLIRRLYVEHGGAVLAYAIRLMGDRALGEDVARETLLRAWPHPESLADNKGSVRGYLFTITRAIAIDRHRARQPGRAGAAEGMTTTPAERDHAEAAVDSMLILGAMDRLSPEHQHVLRLLYFQGRTLDETAASLGVPPGTVKSRSYYALRRLREAMAERPAATGRTMVAEGMAG